MSYDMHAGQDERVGRMTEDAGAYSECEVMTPDDSAVHVRSSW